MRIVKIVSLICLLTCFNQVFSQTNIKSDTVKLTTVYYKVNQFELTKIQKTELVNLFIRNEKQIKTLFIKSYADSKGSPSYNLKLTAKRSELVKHFLDSISNQTIQIQNIAGGIDYRITENDRKRRTEVYIITSVESKDILKNEVISEKVIKTNSDSNTTLGNSTITKIEELYTNKEQKAVINNLQSNSNNNSTLVIGKDSNQLFKKIVSENKINFLVPLREDSSSMGLNINEFINLKLALKNNLNTMTRNGILQSYYMFELKSSDAKNGEKVKVQIPKELFTKDTNMRLYEWDKDEKYWIERKKITQNFFNPNCNCFEIDLSIGMFNLDAPIIPSPKLNVEFIARAPLNKKNLLGMNKYMYVYPDFVYVADSVMCIVKPMKRGKSKAQFKFVPPFKGKIITIAYLYDDVLYCEEEVDISKLATKNGKRVFVSKSKYTKTMPDALQKAGFVAPYFDKQK